MTFKRFFIHSWFQPNPHLGKEKKKKTNRSNEALHVAEKNSATCRGFIASVPRLTEKRKEQQDSTMKEGISPRQEKEKKQKGLVFGREFSTNLQKTSHCHEAWFLTNF